MRNNRIVTYYTPKQVLQDNIALSYSKSPMKPKLVMSEFMKVANPYVRIQPKFKPFTQEDFRIAHTKKWVNTVYNFNKPGEKIPSSIPWSKELVTTLGYTSSSLYHAIKHSIKNPEDITFSPTSGFHHSTPDYGSGFCTFAGQVVSSVKIYREFGKVGCYLDLDGHYGNSIEDCREFVGEELDRAIPEIFNYNCNKKNRDYVAELANYLYITLKDAILDGRVDYVVWCHGADSHEDDDLGGQVNTKEWIECSKVFWSWVGYMDTLIGSPISVSCSLFGGYRKDDYHSVINLHVSDLIVGLNALAHANIDYKLNYKEKQYKKI